MTRTAYGHGSEPSSDFREAFERIFAAPPGKSRSSECLLLTRLMTPLGPMVAGATDAGVCMLEFADRRMLETQVKRLTKWLDCTVAPGKNEHIDQLNGEMERYFAGTLKDFSVKLAIPGTAFQLQVWDCLRRVPYGRTGTYDELAREIGRPGAQRAVGRANGDNRLAIIIPCHRIVRSDGSLCGYGGGLWRKRMLLEHERENAPEQSMAGTAGLPPDIRETWYNAGTS